MKYYGLVMMSVTELVVTAVVFLFIGRAADSHFMSGSRYMTIGAILGFVIGVVRMTLRLKGVMDDTNEP
jgi:F0F1-type ATP synthase assembly protein I